MKKILALFTSKSKDSLDDDDLAGDNQTIAKRNVIIAVTVFCLLTVLWGAFYLITKKSNVIVNEMPPEFASVVTPDFGVKDTQSAFLAQQQEVTRLKSNLDKMTRENAALEEKLESGIKRMTELVNRSQMRSDDRLNQFLDSVEETFDNKTMEMEERIGELALQNGSIRAPFGQQWTNGNGQNANGDTQSQNANDENSMQSPQLLEPMGIQAFSYHYADETKAAYKRTSQNYVPTGSFVTAVMIGAADANAGVNAQGDTAPIVFRTIHDGILPNGKRSRLKGCTVTASVYGEISSNRGIARLDNLSCIFDDKEKGEEILDIPVQGTAFNFGRNGIRGTPVMRNGKIIQMAGISGLFTGLGQTAKNASSTQITGTSGVVTSIDPNQAFLNMGGSALEEVGSKMADYYIKLAEQYHPIIELNPGSVVNLVFLKGFPLDADKLAEYEAKLYGEESQNMTQSLLSTYLNPMSMLPNIQPQNNGQASTQSAAPAQVVNPLINQLPAPLRDQALQHFNNQSQTNPF